MQYSQVLDIYRVQATGTMPGFKNFTNQMNQPSKQQQKKQNPKTKPPPNKEKTSQYKTNFSLLMYITFDY